MLFFDRWPHRVDARRVSGLLNRPLRRSHVVNVDFHIIYWSLPFVPLEAPFSQHFWAIWPRKRLPLIFVVSGNISYKKHSWFYISLWILDDFVLSFFDYLCDWLLYVLFYILNSLFWLRYPILRKVRLDEQLINYILVETICLK